MLGRIRKFSSSIFAKIFLAIIAIPFIFWGMGDLFSGGNQNVIVKIGKEKITTQEFINFIKVNAYNNEELNKNSIEKLFSKFIGDKLIEQEVKDFGILITDKSLSQIIRNEKIFKKNNEFSRIEYEKFLVKNSMSAVNFESNISNQLKREQAFNFIEGGIIPAKFQVNSDYDKINQKRNIKIINLNKVFNKNLNFSEEQIKSYLEKNKENYVEIYKSIKFVRVEPRTLVGTNEFNDLFFKKIDEIDDLIVGGKNVDYLVKKFNLEYSESIILNKLGQNKKLEKNNTLSKELVERIFKINLTDPTLLLEYKDKFYIIELIDTEKFYKKIENKSVKNEILFQLKKQTKIKMIQNLLKEMNNDFNKYDFANFSKKKNINIDDIKIENRNDDKILKKELLNQIYSFPEDKVIVVASDDLTQIYLVYTDKIENASINENSADYQKYMKLSKLKITSSLYNSYDVYLKNKYKIDINYKALDSVKNYF